MSDTPRTDEFFKFRAVSSDNVLLVFCSELERELSLRNQELSALRSLIVEELNEAGIWETFDGEELHTGNWIQGLRLLKRKFLNSEKLVDDLIRQRAADSKRLDWMFSADAEQLNALDQWDRDNIDDAIDREGAE